MSFPYLVNWRTGIKQLVELRSEHETEQRKKPKPTHLLWSLHTFFRVIGKHQGRVTYLMAVIKAYMRWVALSCFPASDGTGHSLDSTLHFGNDCTRTKHARHPYNTYKNLLPYSRWIIMWWWALIRTQYLSACLQLQAFTPLYTLFVLPNSVIPITEYVQEPEQPKIESWNDLLRNVLTSSYFVRHINSLCACQASNTELYI